MNVASIIIPCRNHAQYLSAAIESALAQTVLCEVIVIDDGSTDGTEEMVDRMETARLWRYYRTDHLGVSHARNFGIDSTTEEYLMFLDADDTIEPTKVQRQIEALEACPEAGWCIADTRIIDDVRGEDTTASKRYGYAEMELDGNIFRLLGSRNFIPVHAPLIWRPALGDIRFPDGALEDWAFWHALAERNSCIYLPEVLCTYNARRVGRNRRKAA